MKHIKKFNENWVSNIFKKKSLSEVLAEKSKKIFNDIFSTNDLIYVIETYPNPKTQNEGCIVRFLTKLDDSFGDGLAYSFFIIKIGDNLIFKTFGSSGNIDDFYSFKEEVIPFINNDYLDETIEIFAKKAKPFVEYLLKIDKEKMDNKFKD